VWRGGLGSAYPLPTLWSVGASLVNPLFKTTANAGMCASIEISANATSTGFALPHPSTTEQTLSSRKFSASIGMAANSEMGISDFIVTLISQTINYFNKTRSNSSKKPGFLCLEFNLDSGK
jgi:hypothetical protein